MTDIKVNQIIRFLNTSEDLYHHLVFLVGESGSGKTFLLRETSNYFKTSIINVNLSVSKALLDLTPKQRSLKVPEILSGIIEDASSPAILDNLEILFDNDIKQDPFRLLQHLSRRYTILASWNGSVENGRLVYAKPGHPEFREYNPEDIQLICLD
ncbi:BREX-3 system P-loop-containing protein BrxF [Fidelibacter multiformis]|jgi:Cdc6-like AAA superfamily ATPase|uniref:BREX-3 system P-loop-containing protein BrxF n=1 Tax=Fidelibacter multiformis TaxID=3377529 RepID=UPI0037DDBA35